MKIKLVLLALLSVLITGCATVTRQEANVFPDPQADKGLVYFFREKKLVGSLISFNVLRGDEVIGAMANGTYFFHFVEPGIHTFSAKTEASTSRTLEIEGGETFYIKCGVEMGVFAGRPAMTIVNEQEGRSVLPGLIYATKPKKD